MKKIRLNDLIFFFELKALFELVFILGVFNIYVNKLTSEG